MHYCILCMKPLNYLQAKWQRSRLNSIGNQENPLSRLGIRKFSMHKIGLKVGKVLIIPFIFHLFLQPCFGFTSEEIQRFQANLREKPVGERIAFWAEKFVGTPYDLDPLGEYVSKAAIVADERVDCMYLTFRAVELASSHTPEEAIQISLEKRFHSKGILIEGKVVNYDDRFEYGEDMISSGKWGKDITGEIGETFRIKGSRTTNFADILSSDELQRNAVGLMTGDLIFFIKRPEERKVEEIVGHIGIIKVEQGREVYLIHASGAKGKGGVVKKILLKEYISQMPFIGAKITRFH
jgi:hypothetical protein